MSASTLDWACARAHSAHNILEYFSLSPSLSFTRLLSKTLLISQFKSFHILCILTRCFFFISYRKTSSRLFVAFLPICECVHIDVCVFVVVALLKLSAEEKKHSILHWFFYTYYYIFSFDGNNRTRSNQDKSIQKAKPKWQYVQRECEDERNTEGKEEK